ncbi:MAG: hypothetical protein GY749_28720 [Desulfobacteraceae bacterium]|nr:hypothetical protein [Desulfobacteraceae bacterium]
MEDHEHGIQKDSIAWKFFVKASFVLSAAGMGAGIYYLPADIWVKGYMAMGTVFLIGSSITLTKTIRDEHEAQKLIKKISEVKTEKILKEYDKDLRVGK